MNQDLMECFQKAICLKKLKDGAYITNFDEYADVNMHWIALFYNRNGIVYFDSFYFDIFRVETNDSVMSG